MAASQYTRSIIEGALPSIKTAKDRVREYLVMMGQRAGMPQAMRTAGTALAPFTEQYGRASAMAAAEGTKMEQAQDQFEKNLAQRQREFDVNTALEIARMSGVGTGRGGGGGGGGTFADVYASPMHPLSRSLPAMRNARGESLRSQVPATSPNTVLPQYIPGYGWVMNPSGATTAGLLTYNR